MNLFCSHVLLFVCYLQQDEQEDEEQTPAAREEDPPNTEGEEEHRAPKRMTLSSSLLENLLGQTFTDAQVRQPRSNFARAQEEVKKYCSAPPLRLSEDPLD